MLHSLPTRIESEWVSEWVGGVMGRLHVYTIQTLPLPPPSLPTFYGTFPASIQPGRSHKVLSPSALLIIIIIIILGIYIGSWRTRKQEFGYCSHALINCSIRKFPSHISISSRDDDQDAATSLAKLWLRHIDCDRRSSRSSGWEYSGLHSSVLGQVWFMELSKNLRNKYQISLKIKRGICFNFSPSIINPRIRIKSSSIHLSWWGQGFKCMQSCILVYLWITIMMIIIIVTQMKTFNSTATTQRRYLFTLGHDDSPMKDSSWPKSYHQLMRKTVSSPQLYEVYPPLAKLLSC